MAEPVFVSHGCGAQSRQSAKLFLQSSELGLPHPSPAGECASPPPLVQVGRGTLACGKGVGEAQFRRGYTHCGTLYRYVLYAVGASMGGCGYHGQGAGIVIEDWPT
jgi:hypothetical protein